MVATKTVATGTGVPWAVATEMVATGTGAVGPVAAGPVAVETVATGAGDPAAMGAFSAMLNLSRYSHRIFAGLGLGQQLLDGFQQYGEIQRFLQ